LIGTEFIAPDVLYSSRQRTRGHWKNTDVI